MQALQLVTLPFLADCNNTRRHTLEGRVPPTLDHNGRNDENKDCDKRWILSNALKHLEKNVKPWTNSQLKSIWEFPQQL